MLSMDVRHPTRELTRAAAALRARRTATARKPPWPVSIDGLATLRGLGGVAEDTIVRSKGKCPLTSWCETSS
jgi:hypothetical protein